MGIYREVRIGAERAAQDSNKSKNANKRHRGDPEDRQSLHGEEISKEARKGSNGRDEGDP